MANRKEEEKESNPFHPQIPVFTVLKNDAILKNIFIVNNLQDRENDDVIILGRHPDCNIMLTHPSISRFHLQIHSNPTSQNLYLVDLSSVHGTWVSGKRIEAGEKVEMREGDTLRVGGSSRVYRLHWVPLSSAYDFECPKEMKQEEVAIVEEKPEVDCRKEISLLDESKETVEDSVFGNIGPLYENWKVEMMNEVHLAPPFGQVEDIIMSSIDGGESTSDLKNECEQEETSLLNRPFENELKSLEISTQPPLLSAENLSFNVKNIIMSSFFASETKSLSSSTFERDGTSSIGNIPLENVSRSSLSGKQQWDSKPQPPSLPLSAENLSFNVENIIMSSFFDSDTKTSSCNMSEWEETCSSISTIQLENKSNILSAVDNIKAGPENAYQLLNNENKCPRPRSASLCKEYSSDVEDSSMIAFTVGECKSSSRNEFEQNKISSNVTIHRGHEVSHVVVVDDEKPVSDNEYQQFDDENGRLLEETNVSSNVGDVVEVQYLPVHEVESPNTQPLLDLQSETVTEKNEFKEEHKLHPLEDNHSSIIQEEEIQEMKMLNKKQTEVGEDYADKENEDTYQVAGCFLDCQSQYKSESSMKTTSEVKPNSPINQNVECWVEHKYNTRLETLEPSFVPFAMEFVHSSLLDEQVSPKIPVKKESATPHENVDATSVVRSENISDKGGSIWLRRGKPTSFPRIETGVSRTNRVGTSVTDEIVNHEIEGDQTVVNNILLSHLGGEEEEEETFTPDKENFTPNTLLMKSLKKKANLEDSGNSFRSSKSQTSIFKSRHKVKQEEWQSEESDKENQTPKVLQEQKLSKQISKNRRFGKEKLATKRGGTERTPFQSLQSNFAEKKRPEAAVVKSTKKSNISISPGDMKNKFTVEGKKRWNMVVDINSLLNKESMKSLQLLQGLQGTHLIIPRIVVRELNCLKRHSSLFRKTTEAASILQWIEDCMVQTSWWIHVQSSEEGGGPPATPPATPQSLYPDQSLFWRTASSIQSIKQRSFMEALSPTPEDHILDCALHFRRGGVNHGQLVLLSDDVTLKIKAMAEGLICETAKEFRESLVNPFSERFLWADSSPRGLTWSCPDDVVLRERYNHRCLSRSSKGTEGAKGLKLILLHNSHYGMLR